MSSETERLLARIDELERRLAVVETQPKRRLGLSAYALVLLFASIMVFAAFAPTGTHAQDGEKGAQEITCKKLTVVDGAGKPRVVLSFDAAGGQIKVFNSTEKNVASIVTEQFGGIFRLFGNDAKKLLIAGGNKDGCQVNVCAPDGNIRGYLGVDSVKEGYVSLRSKDDKTILYAGADDDGGLVRAYGPDGKERAFFGCGNKQGDGIILLYGTDQKRRHWIGSDDAASSHYIYAKDGTLQHEIRGGKTGAYHTMMTKDGKHIIATIGASNDSGEGILRLNTNAGKTTSYFGSNKNGSGGLILLNTPDDSTRVVIGIDGNGVGFGEGRDADNVIRRSFK